MQTFLNNIAIRLEQPAYDVPVLFQLADSIAICPASDVSTWASMAALIAASNARGEPATRTQNAVNAASSCSVLRRSSGARMSGRWAARKRAQKPGLTTLESSSARMCGLQAASRAPSHATVAPHFLSDRREETASGSKHADIGAPTRLVAPRSSTSGLACARRRQTHLRAKRSYDIRVDRRPGC